MRELAVYVSYATPLVPRVWLGRNKTDVPALAFPSPTQLGRSGRPSHRPLPAVTAEVSGLGHSNPSSLPQAVARCYVGCKDNLALRRVLYNRARSAQARRTPAPARSLLAPGRSFWETLHLAAVTSRAAGRKLRRTNGQAGERTRCVHVEHLSVTTPKHSFIARARCKDTMCTQSPCHGSTVSTMFHLLHRA